MNKREIANEIFLAGVERVKPENLIQGFISLEKNVLIINTLKFDLGKIKNIFIIGAGKASAMMARSIESILGDKITSGHIITKYRHTVKLKYIGITEAGHPVPDENGLSGTDKMLKIATEAKENDLVICLISGGGSALMADVPEGCTLSDLKTVNEALLKSGANISEMNCIRKHLSKVKGGQLAKTIAPATIVSLILSDVIGDHPNVIASGPTSPDPTTFADALKIIKKYKLENEIPIRIIQVLKEGLEGKLPETLKENEELMKLTYNFIIGSNHLALNESAKKAMSFGYEPLIITDTLDEPLRVVAKIIVGKAMKILEGRHASKVCLLFGGEPVIKVTGNGLGGRNQHLSLVVANLLKDVSGITFLSAGTDGSDGPTDAAGAVCDSDTSVNADKLKLDIDKYLADFNSYHFFKKEGGLIVTGPTQTNVMDIMLALID